MLALPDLKLNGLLIVVLGVLACGPPATPSATLVVANNAEVHSLDPHLATGAPEGRVLSAMYAGLTRLDHKTLKVVPELAKSFHSPDEGLTWVFELRSDLHWSDGSAITAKDVVDSWQRLANPATGAPYRDWLADIQADGIHAVGNTVTIQFQHPTPWFPSMCSWYSLAPLPPGLVSGEQLAGKVVSGPFKLAFHNIRDRVRLLANPHYFRADKVQLDAIDFLVVESQFTALNLFLSGDADFLPDVPALAVPALLEDYPEEFAPQAFFATYFYRLNCKEGATKNKLVRRALSLAINREELAATLGTGQPAAKNFVPPYLDNYSSPELDDFDPELAKQLLQQAGYNESNPLPAIEILFNSAELHRDVAEAMQMQWRKNLGIESRLFNQEWKVFIDTQRQLKYQVSRSSWIGDYLDPSTFLNIFHSQNANNRTGWSNQNYDDLLRSISLCPDPEQRMRLCKQAELLLLQESPIIPLFFYSGRELVSSRVSGFERNLIGRIDWSALSLVANP